MQFDEVIGLVPAEWTAWQLRSRRNKTAFVFTMTKMEEGIEVESEPGHGATPTEAALACIEKNRK